MITSTSTNMTTTLQPQQPDLKMMKPPPPPAEMFEQRRRSNSASPSDKLLKRSYHHSSTSGGCPSPLALRPKTYQVIPVVVLALPVNKSYLLILWFLWQTWDDLYGGLRQQCDGLGQTKKPWFWCIDLENLLLLLQSTYYNLCQNGKFLFRP